MGELNPRGKITRELLALGSSAGTSPEDRAEFWLARFGKSGANRVELLLFWRRISCTLFLPDCEGSASRGLRSETRELTIPSGDILPRDFDREGAIVGSDEKAFSGIRLFLFKVLVFSVGSLPIHSVPGSNWASKGNFLSPKGKGEI